MRLRLVAVALATAFVSMPAAAQEVAAAPAQEFGALTLEDALALADAHSPRLAEARHAIGMAEGDVITAGLWPNPNLSVGIEGYTPGGEDPPRDRTRLENGVEVANRVLARGGSAVSLFVPGVPEPDEPEQQQWVVGLEQEVPLGPERRLRREAAKLDQSQFTFELRQTVADVHGDVRAAYLDALYYQEAAALQRELAGRLAEVRDLVRARFEAGDVAELEVIKADAALARLEADASEANLRAALARTTLMAAIGLPSSTADACSGTLVELVQRLDAGALAALEPEHPLLGAWEARQAAAEARVAAADAARWPNLELGLGYRYYEATEQDTWDFAVGVELPIFNRNQGERHKARENALREAAAITAERNRLERDLLGAAQAADRYEEAVVQYEEDVIAPMSEVLRIAQAAYDAGDASLLEVLDAHRELAQARLNYTGYVREYAAALNELVRLTASGL